MVHSASGISRRGPVAAKVPEITFLFWVIKLLTTAGGEATSDYLALHGNLVAGAVEVAIFVVAVIIQFRTRRYVAAAYWFLALAIAIFGTGVADAMHLIVGIPYAGTTRAVGHCPGGHLLGLVPHRGNAVDPQHHHHAPRAVLLGHGVRHLRPRDRAR